MAKALYRKYRSKSLSEIIGQEHITETLGKALKQGTVSHAYLFTGPRGTGKTSIARILAQEVNKLPYSEQPQLDIIEIDAASNRRIDEIRELKERVHVAPTSLTYKVYIIDEVHMLTKEAFNALLKTLEEPPAHVIFILATTEVHKVPETIVSRTQRFTFKPVPVDKVVQHLAHIAKAEAINIDPDALRLIAAIGEGSFRDSISLLDQVRHLDDHITLDQVQQAIGQAPQALLVNLLDTIRAKNLAATAENLAALTDHGIQPQQVAKQLSAMLRQDVLAARPQLPLPQSLQLLNDLSMVAATTDPTLKLELALYSSVLSGDTEARAAASPTPQPVTKIKQTAGKLRKLASPPTKEVSVPSPVDSSFVLTDESWPTILSAIKAKHNTLYSVTRMAVPSFEPGKLTLNFAFAFHQKRLEESKNKQLLAQIIKEVTGQSIAIECRLDKTTKEQPGQIAPAEQPDVAKTINLEAISNIFGGAEVVE